MLRNFVTKLSGVPGAAPMPRPPLKQVAVSFAGAVCGVGTLTLVHKLSGSSQATMLVATTGATAALLFAAPTAPFSQPRNVIGGHTLAAIIGTSAYHLLGNDFLFTPALAVGATIAGMQLTSTFHPPAGGTALIAILGGQPPFFLVPVFIGSVAQVGVACVFNNLIPGRRYPQHW